jgi:rhodanese-related sulfurtransferase
MAKTAAELVQEARAQIQNVSPKNALDEIASGKAVLLDVREPAEWEEHIEGSVQVPRGIARVRCRSHESAAQLRAGSEPPRDRVLQVGGTRHARRAHPENNGYENIANIDGGFTACTEAGFPINKHHATPGKAGN